MNKPSTIAFIPVRGGSKSIPMKNIKSFYGSPLVYWCLSAASQSQQIDKVVLATDDLEIKKIVEGFALPKVEVYDRLPQNASDTASTESVMLEYLAATDCNPAAIFVLIQATSPFLKAKHLDEGIQQYHSEKKDSLLSVVPSKRFYWTKEGTALNYDVDKRPRRQDFEGIGIENGAFYVNTVDNIKKFENRLSGTIACYDMPEFSALELDEPEDWALGEYFMARYGYKRLLPSIKLFATDVDGVLTDASMYYTAEGDVMKRFNTHDGMGLQLLQKQGIKTAIITSEDTQIVAQRAKKLGVDYVYQGKRHGGKLDAINEMCADLDIGLHEVAYIGDDINCLEALVAVGLKACPSNATPKVKAIPGILQLETKGGDGAVRELIEKILA